MKIWARQQLINRFVIIESFICLFRFASSLSLHEYLHPATLWVDLLHHLNNTMSLLEMKLPYDPVCPSVMSSVGRSVGWSVSEVDKSFTLLLLSEHLCDLQLKIYDSNPRLPQVSRADHLMRIMVYPLYEHWTWAYLDSSHISDDQTIINNDWTRCM